MGNSDLSSESIDRAEHIDPATTGDNIAAKKVTPYFWDGTNWRRSPTALIDQPYDYVVFTSPDGNGNYQTVTFKSGGSGGVTIRSLALSFDSNSNITSITRS